MKTSGASNAAGYRGFTLIELLVVIAIIGLLASVILASLNIARTKGQYARNLQMDANMKHTVGDSLVGEWLFDDNKAGIATDSSGFNNNGTFSGPTYTTDTPFGTGYALSFNNSGVVSIGAPAVLNTSSGFTYAVWYERTGTSINQWPEILDSGNGDTHTYYGIRSISYGDTIRFEYGTSPYGGSTYAAQLCGDGSAPLNTWIMVVASYDGSTMRCYKNGSTGGAVSVALNPNIAGIHIGFNTLMANIDSVRIYSRAFDAAEVRSLYFAEAPKHGIAFAGVFGMPF